MYDYNVFPHKLAKGRKLTLLEMEKNYTTSENEKQKCKLKTMFYN